MTDLNVYVFEEGENYMELAVLAVYRTLEGAQAGKPGRWEERFIYDDPAAGRLGWVNQDGDTYASITVKRMLP